MRLQKTFLLKSGFLRHVPKWLTVALIGTLVVCGCALRGASSFESKPAKGFWPQSSSDLRPDPRLVFGRLGNGLRFVMRKNETPRNRVSMHLVVQTGSLDEKPEERGIAHFLEHMVFNGSVHFAPGEMVKFFQRIGMQFGPDANAHTGFTQTVYDVVLPHGDAEILSEGLLVLRDYADGALLLPDEVAREKKVVLAEMRSRDSAGFRTFEETLRFELPGLLISKRLPIGKANAINNIDHRMLQKFYATWYRPERMFLVVVGDLDTDVAEHLIRDRFADLEPRMPAGDEPKIGSMVHKGVKAFYHHEVESGATRVAIETVAQNTEPEDSMLDQLRRMVTQLSDNIMQHRLDVMVQRPDSAFTSAGIRTGYYLRQIKYSEIESECKPGRWPRALEESEQALRRAIDFGFTGAELQRVKNDYEAHLRQAAKEEDTRDSNLIAREIITALNNWRVMQSPRQRAEILIPMLETVTLAQVNQAMAQNWAADHRLLLVTGNADLGSGSETPEEQVLDVYREALAAKLRPAPEEKRIEFPYLPEPAVSGVVQSRRHIEDLNIEQLEFSNGFRLNLKPTRFKANEVVAALSFGGGEASEPRNQPGLSKLAQAVVNESGFGSMNRIELETALAGRLARTDFAIREDKFLISGKAATDELSLLFQLMRAFIEDSGYREEARQLALNRFQQDYQSMPHSTEGMLQFKGQRFLAGGDPRFGAPPWDQLRKRSIQEIRTWIGSQMDPVGMELAVVGDFDVDEVVGLAARYLGSLEPFSPEKRKVWQLSESGPKFPQGQSLELPVQTDIAKAMVVVAFPTEDFWDIRRTRRLTVLAELVSERLREDIREKLGAAYSPYAYNHSFRAYKGYGLLQILVKIDPHQTDAIVKEIQHIVDELAASGPNADEFRRILDPTLTYIKDLRQKNSYWLNSVLTGVSRWPQQLEWSRSFEKDYASITAEELFHLARRYLVQKKAATIVLSPAKSDTP